MKHLRICALLAGLSTTAIATQAQTADTLVVEQPGRVIVIKTPTQETLEILGRKDNPEYRYFSTTLLTPEAVSQTKESSRNIDFTLRLNRCEDGTTHTLSMRNIGFGLVSAIGAPQGMHIDTRTSWEIMWPHLLSWSVTDRSRKNIYMLGAGINWKNFRMTDNNRFIKEGNHVSLGHYPEGATPDFSRIKVFSLSLSPAYRHKLSRHWAVEFSPGIHFNTYSSIKTRYEQEGIKHKLLEKGLRVNPISLDLTASLHYRWLGVYAKYSPTPVFRNGFGPDFRTFSFGIVLY